MAKQITKYESDGITPAQSSYDEGTVKDGEATTPRRIWWKNTSSASETLESCRFRRAQVGANDGYQHLELAPDVDGAPGAWQTDPIVIGDLPVGDMVACWMRYVIPADTTQVGNPRRAWVQFEET